jgi:DNA-binding winged helix-turn-helix (wHTH) protein|tara:strand:- start:1146 stop:1745 length:600 start_codon:yes stop_codon:yes gene_type:complete
MPAIKTKSINVAKGFALYVGISEQDAQDAGLTLAQIAQALKQTIATLVPAKASETYAAIALAPEGSTGRNLDITRLALREPRATSTPTNTEADEKTAAKGLVVDLTRKRLFVDGANAQLTCKEFELFAFLIENTGETVSRKQIADISDRCGESTPNARTIDVHVRRLRAKIAGYEDVIRTSRGVGYRFDKHPDVLVQQF